MKTIILFVLTTAVWAEELYVKNEGTPVIFGVGSDGDHIMTILPQNRFCDHARRPIVDEVFQGRAYHFSWCHNGGRSYTWYDASHHCQRLGNGFQAVSIEHPNEDNFVAGVLRTYQMRDIWTSGTKLGSYQWYWETGVSTGYTNWSNTGRLGRSQPDNADGNEQCLAVVNSLGVGWHDSRCNTLRPVICETEAFYRQ
ncbi:C-type lectin-like 21 [Homarus americanus]|uniref:C-type lectin-like 21 n=1 Tax=Homarus americanus TaxID=6706 RepID=A0A8J5TJT6_HOMAM|nr:C-type lectin-like 21 [Homarus americanus]